MCRAPIFESLQRVKLPSQIAFDKDLGTAIAARNARAYEEALAKEEALESRIKRTLISVPLVPHPGQLPRDHKGRARCFRFSPKTTLELVVSDPKVQDELREAEKTGQSVGFVFDDGAESTERTKRGYVAQVVKTSTGRRNNGELSARVTSLQKITFDERDVTEKGRKMVAMVELVQ